jgi:hypothetical protein
MKKRISEDVITVIIIIMVIKKQAEKRGGQVKKDSRGLFHANYPAFSFGESGNLLDTSVVTGGGPREILNRLSPGFKKDAEIILSTITLNMYIE